MNFTLKNLFHLALLFDYILRVWSSSSKTVESKSEATIDMANQNYCIENSSITSSFANNNSNNNRSTTATDIEIASSSCPRIISSEGVSDGFPGEILFVDFRINLRKIL